MAFETILINAEREQTMPRLLEVAETIATAHRSHIVGLAVLPPSLVLPAGAPGAPDVVTYDSRRRAARAEFERSHRLFNQMAAGKALQAEWRLDEDDGRNQVDALIAHCRLADLVISGPQQAGDHDAFSFQLAERLVIEAGRPVVLVPKSETRTTCGRRILIAWNGSREATRAVFDALPLLQSAQHVKVLQVDTRERASVFRLSGADVCGMLARHGVQASPKTLELPRATAGAALLSAVKAENADLLVMGGYGRWRVRELILGGATHHVLRHMTVPVLMSH